MKFEIDCQIHSCYSPDAGESPDRIFKQAKSLGLKGVVITDHNTVMHFEDILLAAKKYNLLTCEALEITANYEGSDIHILAYGNNFNKKILEPLLSQIRESYNVRSKTMLRKLSEAGVASIQFDDLLKETKSGCVTKPLIAKYLSKVKNIDQKNALAFFERGGTAFVPYGVTIPTPFEVVSLINKAGGKAVFAHPGDFFGKRSPLPFEKKDEIFQILLKEMLKAGLKGIEVWYPSHTKEQIGQFKNIAEKYGLLMTGGSDYHGIEFGSSRKIGQAGIDEECFLKLVS